MSVFGFNDYEALPGHKVAFKDGNLNLKNDPLAEPTESIVFLGTATDGPVNQPIQVTPETAYTIFGKVTHDNGISNGANLLPAFEEAWQAGNRDIRLMRVTGKSAIAALTAKSFFEHTTQTTSEEFVGHGNDTANFRLPHGGLVAESIVVKANGFTLTEGDQYTVALGDSEIYEMQDVLDGDGNPVLEEDGVTPVQEEVLFQPATQAILTLKKDVVDMESDITITYDFVTLHGGDLEEQTHEVLENNTDASGNPMVAKGYTKDYTLSELPKEGVRVYVNGKEILDNKVFKVEGQVVKIGTTDLINFQDGVEIAYSYNVSNEVFPEIELESIYGGAEYNKTTSSISKDENGIVTVVIKKPASKKAIMSEQDLIFKSTNFPNFQLLVNAINSHPLNNVVRAKVATQFAAQFTSTLEPKTSIPFSGGSDELNLSKEELYKRLGGVKDSEGYIVEQGAYQYLENYSVDYVIPLGVHSDDKLIGKYDNFAYQLALACAVMSHYNHVTIGLINTTTPATTGLKDIEDHVQKLEALPNEFYMRDRFGAVIQDGEGDRIDLGQFIQLIAGPDLIVGNTRLGMVASNTPGVYAGFVSQLRVESAPTNKPLAVAQGLRFQYSNAQLNRLTKARYVTYKIKPNGQVGIVDAMTAAHVGSDYTRLSTVRAVKEAVNQVREVSDPFLGEANDVANHNALAAAIEKRLGKMVEKRALMDYDFHIVVTPEMELMGEGQIELSLRAPKELRNLTTIVSLT